MKIKPNLIFILCTFLIFSCSDENKITPDVLASEVKKELLTSGKWLISSFSIDGIGQTYSLRKVQLQFNTSLNIQDGTTFNVAQWQIVVNKSITILSIYPPRTNSNITELLMRDWEILAFQNNKIHLKHSTIDDKVYFMILMKSD